MTQTLVAACVSLLMGWVGFGAVLAHAPADTTNTPATTSIHA